MYLSKEKFTCPKEKIMRQELILSLTVLKLYINSTENNMKHKNYILLETV